jgi:hypothetical protein
VVPLLDRSSERMTASDAGGGAATELAQGPPAPVAGLPVIRVPGEVSAAAVRSRLATDPRAIRALASAGGARSSAGGSATADSPTPEAAPKDQGGTDRSGTGQGGTGQGGTGEPGTGTGQGGTGEPGTGTGEPGAGQAGDTPPSTPASPAANLQSCLPAATAAADPASIPLTPAFFVEGTYQGRPATILVTTSTTQPGRVDLWVFPRADCTAAPLATERVR